MASESLERITSASFAHMKSADRKKLVRDLKSRASKVVKKAGNGLKSIEDIYHDLARKLKNNG